MRTPTTRTGSTVGMRRAMKSRYPASMPPARDRQTNSSAVSLPNPGSSRRSTSSKGSPMACASRASFRSRGKRLNSASALMAQALEKNLACAASRTGAWDRVYFAPRPARWAARRASTSTA